MAACIVWMDKICSCTCPWLQNRMDGPRNTELRLPERSHNDIVKQMRCIVKSLRITSVVQTPQLLHSRFPFLMECWSFHQAANGGEQSTVHVQTEEGTALKETQKPVIMHLLQCCLLAERLGIFLLFPLFTYHRHVFIKLL